LLAHQLITARLNFHIGAAPPAAVLNALQQTPVPIGSLVRTGYLLSS
jgi:hypothetical protein